MSVRRSLARILLNCHAAGLKTALGESLFAASLRSQSTQPTPLLLRDYIQHHLYDASSGYFAQQVKIGGEDNRGLSDPIEFNRLLDEDDFQLKVKSIYEQGSGAWLTPVELFRPWYGYAIADHILTSATRHGTKEPPYLEIFEIGSGSGTCMMDVLDRIQQTSAGIFERTTYTCIEISKRLAEAQVRRAELAGLDKDRWDVIHADFLAMNEELPSSEECAFVLAFEVLDNLPHDKVIFDDEGQPWEAVIVPKETRTSDRLKRPVAVMDFVMSFTEWERMDLQSDTLRELYRPVSDALLLRMMDYMHELEEKTLEDRQPESMLESVQNALGYGQLRYSKTGVLTPSSAVRSNQGTAYIPTGQLQFLEALQKCFPYHSLILSDFDSLPGMVLPGAGGPAVQSIGASNHICDRSSYLLPQNTSADIFFPTDFVALRQLYEKITKNQSRVLSAKEFFAPCDESLHQCRAMNGYCPLTEYYSNTSYLVADGYADAVS